MASKRGNNGSMNDGSGGLCRRGLMFGVAASGTGLVLGGCAPIALTRGEGRTRVPQDAMNDRLKAIGARVLVPPLTTQKWSVYSDQEDGFGAAASQGSVNVSAAVLALCRTDGHIAAIIAHPVALLQEASPMNVMVMVAPLNAPAQDRDAAAALQNADLTAIAALARAGYDPRDAREIWQIIGLDPTMINLGYLSQEQRLAAMATQLRTMGYQV